ncbi:hypothetical protein CSUI_009403, partial [Cystoisospora suis]
MRNAELGSCCSGQSQTNESQAAIVLRDEVSRVRELRFRKRCQPPEKLHACARV